MIPTHRRPAILGETLKRLALYAPVAPIEVLVIDDGSAAPGTEEAVRKAVAGTDWSPRVLFNEDPGPASKRNRAITEARAPVLLFIGDDALPSPTLVSGHLAFHASHPEPADAALGLVVPAAPLDRYPFLRWLHEHGAQFGYAELRPGDLAGPRRFWTANVSVKRELLRRAGGFDESFPGAAAEDIEFGFRLAAAGMRLYYDPAPVAHHFHPTDLRSTLFRMRDIGVAFRTLCERVPEVPPPSRPAPRHRLKAAALTVAMAAGRTTAARHAAWRFLCDEMLRESYWAAGADGKLPRVGRTLARLALADPQANPPLPDAPSPI